MRLRKTRLTIAVRPEKIQLHDPAEDLPVGICHARGTITEVVYLGTVTGTPAAGMDGQVTVTPGAASSSAAGSSQATSATATPSP